MAACTAANLVHADEGPLRNWFNDPFFAVRDTSLWITVQRRIVWVEGCVAPGYRPGAIERLVQKVPDVELVVVNVRRGPKGEVPYRVLPPR